MHRRDFLVGSAAISAASLLAATGTAAAKAFQSAPIVNDEPLVAPKKGKINVAVAIAERATIIDFCGPWEVFQDVHVPERGSTMDEIMPFRLYTVARSMDPITASAGMKIMPKYSVDNAPKPDLVVVPAMQSNDAMLQWLAAVAPETDLTMSVCTGAFQLGKAGLLDGLVATTHHNFYDNFEDSFPDVTLKRGVRFVENKRISTAGGLTSGIDLALRVVERYFGRDIAQMTADYMEYTSDGWKV